MKARTIGGAMLGIAVLAVILGALRAWPMAAVGGAIFLVPASVAALAGWGRPRLAAWSFTMLAVAATLAMTVAYVGLPYLGYRGMVSMLVALLLLALATGVGLAWAALPDGRTGKARRGLMVALAFALPASMIATRWPLRLAFFAASPALNAIADRIAAGETLTAPEPAGPFRVYRALPHGTNGDILLRLGGPGRSGRWGFVRSAAMPPDPSAPREWLGGDREAPRRWSSYDED